MKKIYVNKTDSAASVIEKVISSGDSEVTLYIPRDTEFSRLKNNFRLLKREAEQAKKEVTVESVEDIVLESAASLGIKAVNPFFGQKVRMVSDIGMRAEVDGPMTQSRRQDIKQPEKKPKNESAKAEEIFTAREFGGEKDSIWDEEDDRPRSRKLTFALIFSAIVLIAVGAALYMVLPEATITVTLSETPFPYTGPLVINSNVKTASATTTQITIPGTIFSDTENNVVEFSVSGSKNVSQSASGSITIYNDYSSGPQVLVKSTRFTAPNGKVYRLNSTVTVPGATASRGQIVPSSVEATVTADQPGVDYNISTTTRFRIPGFQGTAKYDGFYADSSSPITGGFIGNMAVPTAADIATARSAAESSLNTTLENKLLLTLPSGIKVLDGSSQIATTSEVISSTPNSQGQYSLTIYGTIKIFGFNESDLLSAVATEMASQPNASVTDLSLHDYSANYSNAKPDFVHGIMTASLNLTSNWTQPFDASGFQTRAEGLDSSALNTLISSFSGVESANVNLWPFWVRRVPQNPSKIHVDVGYAS